MIPLWRSCVALAVLAVAIAICGIDPAPSQLGQLGVRTELPIKVGDFIGRQGQVSEAERRLLPKDTTFSRRIYANFDPFRYGPPDVIWGSLIVAGSDDRSIHRPEVCLSGQGYNKDIGQVIPIQLKDGSTIHIMELIVSKDTFTEEGQRVKGRAVFTYWFVGKDVTTPSHWRRMFLSSWDLVFHNVAHRWAYFIVQSEVSADFQPGGRDLESTQRLTRAFIRELAPQMHLEKVSAPAAN